MNLSKMSLVLSALVIVGCSGEVGETADLGGAEFEEVALDDSSEFGTAEEAFTEPGCATLPPNITKIVTGPNGQQIDTALVPYGQVGCTHARRIGVVVNGVLNSKILVQPTGVPSPAECTQTTVRARLYRNGVLRANLSKAGTLVGGACQRPSVGGIFPMGDGAIWRLIVQAKLGGTADAGGVLRSVQSVLTNQ